MRTLVVFLLADSLSSQATIDPQTLLNEARRRVALTVQRVPRYTCTESIERFWYATGKVARPGWEAGLVPLIAEENLVRSDRLHIDVAVGSGQEMFAWHGQRSFQTDEIDQLVSSGPISSGSYFSFLSSIFLEGLARINYGGLRLDGSRQVAVFEYSVSISQSHFETRTASGKDVMGYHGEFTVNPSTGELEQLDILTDDMPDGAAACNFATKTTYAASMLNGSPFQLPESVTMDVVSRSHEKTRTVTHYRQCHEFTSQSVLRFDEAPGEGNISTSRTARTLPAGLPVRIRIKLGVDPEMAWAGDPVEGELAADIVDSKMQLLAPKGAPVHGLILDAAILRRPSRSYVIALQFVGLKFGRGRLPAKSGCGSRPRSGTSPHQ
jgi:hypothetical protein